MYASRYGHVEIVRFLSKNGAKLNCADENGMTPLMHSATKARLDREGSTEPHLEVVWFLVRQYPDLVLERHVAWLQNSRLKDSTLC